MHWSRDTFLIKLRLYIGPGNFTKRINVGPVEKIQKLINIQPKGNQIYLVTLRPRQLAQASFLQKNQTLQNVFLISVTLRWHRASVACKNQSL